MVGSVDSKEKSPGMDTTTKRPVGRPPKGTSRKELRAKLADLVINGIAQQQGQQMLADSALNSLEANLPPKIERLVDIYIACVERDG